MGVFQRKRSIKKVILSKSKQSGVIIPGGLL